jgi:hypothetical protein
LGSPAASSEYVRLILIVGRVWAGLSEYGELLKKFGAVAGPWETSFALRAIDGWQLGNFGEGWDEPSDLPDYRRSHRGRMGVAGAAISGSPGAVRR